MRRLLSASAATTVLLLVPIVDARDGHADRSHPAVSLADTSADAASARPAARRQAERRAEASYRAMRTYFAAHDGSGLYREHYPAVDGDPTYSYEWPFSQAHIAALDLTGLPGEAGRRYRPELRRHVAAQEHYWSPKGTTGLPGYASGALAPYGEGGDFFYDDNEWVGLAQVQRYLMSGDTSRLARAKQIFRLVVSGWDDDASHPAPGGTFWTQAPWSQDRNTVSNMPGALLGLRLYQLTGKQTYLRNALRMYRWTNQHLQRSDGLYWDNIHLDGGIDKTVWSYNQGVPIGVNVLLAEVTGKSSYLREARRIAKASFGYYVSGGRLGTQPPYFNSIYFKNLLLLGSVTGAADVRRYRDAMSRYADDLWTSHRDKKTGLFHTRSGADGAGTELLEQAAAVQVFALLAWSPRRYDQIS